VRIVSLSPTSTEVLFAIGAGDQVVAVDSLSNFPAEAPVTELSSFTPNVEAIAAYDPDVVFISYDPGDLVAGLEAIGIPVIVHGTAFTLDAAYGQWEQTGAVTGHVADAAMLVAETETDLAAATDSVGDAGEGVTYYYEIDNTFYTTTSASFIGQLLAPLGVVNIADDAEDPGGFGYPQLSPEFIVDSDPALILLADTKCCGESAVTIAARPGWDTMTAISTGSVVELDDDIASRWGPRVVELVEAVAKAINNLVGVGA
jgi:iron complex transport system substrate-binding protein